MKVIISEDKIKEPGNFSPIQCQNYNKAKYIDTCINF